MTNENSYFYLSQKAIASRITVARKMIFSLGMSPTCFRLAVECLRRQHTGSAWIKGRGSIRFRAGDSRFFVWSLLILNIEEVNKIQWYNYKTKATTVDRMGNAITGPSFEKKKKLSSCLWHQICLYYDVPNIVFHQEEGQLPSGCWITNWLWS